MFSACTELIMLFLSEVDNTVARILQRNNHVSRKSCIQLGFLSCCSRCDAKASARSTLFITYSFTGTFNILNALIG